MPEERHLKVLWDTVTGRELVKNWSFLTFLDRQELKIANNTKEKSVQPSQPLCFFDSKNRRNHFKDLRN